MGFAFGFITTAFQSAGGFFTRILNALPGSADIVIAGVFLALLVRYLIKPIVGAGSSDFARSFVKSHKSSSGSNSKSIGNKGN